MVSDGTCLSATTFQTGFVSTKEGCTSWTISTHHTSNHQYFKPPTTENPLFICPPFQPPTLQDRYIYIYMHVSEEKNTWTTIENSSPWDVDSHAKKLTHTRKFPHGFSSVILPPLHICSSTITIQVKTELVEVLCGSHCPIGSTQHPQTSPKCLWKRCDHPFHISHPPLPMPPSLLPLRPLQFLPPPGCSSF